MSAAWFLSILANHLTWVLMKTTIFIEVLFLLERLLKYSLMMFYLSEIGVFFVGEGLQPFAGIDYKEMGGFNPGRA